MSLAVNDLVARAMKGETFNPVEEAPAVATEDPVDLEATVPEVEAPHSDDDLAVPDDLQDARATEADTLPDEPPKDGRKWAELKAKIKDYEQRLAEAEKAPKEIPEELKAEYERKLAEVEERYREKDEALARLDLARSDKFKREYISKLDGILGRASGLLKQHAGFDDDQSRKIISAAFRKPFAERNRYLMDEAPELHSILSTMMLQADEQRQVIDDALAHHQATQAALEESTIHEKTVSSVKQIEESLATAVQDLAVEGNRYYRKSKGATAEADAWNSNVDRF